MQKIKKIYRSNYQGEEIILNANYKDGEWLYDCEYIPNSVTNTQITNQACIIGNGYSREGFEMFLLTDHKGGLGGNKALQLYGCNALHRDVAPQFLVATTDAMCQEIIASGYYSDHIVYTTSQFVLRYPGYFYLIPQDPHWNAGTIATYLACFDGHTKIYLLGFDNSAGENLNNNIYAGTSNYEAKDHNYDDSYWVKSMAAVMRLYSDVEFVRVMPTPNWRIPDEWRALQNFRQIDTKRFVFEADL